MEFCPKCEALLKKKNNELICSTKDCGYTKKIGKTVKEKPGELDPDFLVMGESDMRKDQGLKSTDLSEGPHGKHANPLETFRSRH